MKKTLLELIATLAVIGAVFFMFHSVHWMELFGVRPDYFRGKMERAAAEMVTGMHGNIEEAEIVQPIDTLLTEICRSNHIDRGSIHLYVVDSEEVNAYAFLNNSLIINKGLLEDCRNESELAGVLGHELAHLQLGHVQRMITMQVGLSLFLAQLTGNAETAASIVSSLLTNTFSRTQEADADAQSVRYLLRSKIAAAPLADFLERMAQDDQLEAYLEWISTHPAAKSRAAQIRKLAARQKDSRAVLHPHTWKEMKRSL